MLAFNSTSMWRLFITEQYVTTLFVHYIVDSTVWLRSIVIFTLVLYLLSSTYFTLHLHLVLHFTLMHILLFNINSTFYFGAYLLSSTYFTLQLHLVLLFMLALILLSSTLLASTHIFY